MLNFRKRIFLFLTLIMTVLCLVSCTDVKNTVRINLEENEYTVRMQSTLTVKPVIKASADFDMNGFEVVYESSNEEVVRYVNGILYPISEGEAQIKVYWKDKDVIFDKATVKVIKPALPELLVEDPVNVLKNDEVLLPYTLYKNYTDAKATFKTLTPEIATIDETGRVKALKVGTALFEAVVSDYAETSEVYTIKVNVVESDFSIKYVLDGGVNAETNPVGYNTLNCPIELAPATKEGYDFVGWKLDGQIVNEIPANTTGDLELVAVWKTVEYKLELDVDGGTFEGELPTSYTADLLPLALPTLTKEGYEFQGWKLDKAVVKEIKEGTTGDLTLKAVWKALEWNVSFDLDGGEFPGTYATREEMVNDFMKDFGAFAKIEMTTPAQYWAQETARTTFWKDAKMHAKWSWIFKALIPFAKAQGIDTKYLVGMNADPISISGYATQNVAVYLLGINNAKWNETYAATYKGLSSKWTTVNCTSEAVLNSWVQYVGVKTTRNTDEEFVLPTPAKPGYDFAGWFDAEDNQVEKVEAGTLTDVAVKAKWTLANYNINFDYAGGTLVGKYATREDMVNDFMKDFGAFAKIDMTTPAQYWAQDPARTTFWKDAKMYAKWSWIFKALVPLAKSQYQETTYLDNMLADPISISGYATQNVAVYLLGINNAKWNETYAATYNGLASRYTTVDSTSEKALNSWIEYVGMKTTYTIFDEVTLPTLTKEGYTFVGWFNGEQKVETIAAGTYGDLNLVAKFEGNKYEIEYVLEEGATLPEGAAKEYLFGTGLATLPVPTKEGYDFLGWYEGETKVEAIAADRTGKVTLTAKFEKQAEVTEFEITYNLDGGTLPEDAPTKYTKGVGLASLVTPTKEGYTFLGWYLNGELVTAISASQEGNVTLEARWEEIVQEEEYEITYDLDGGSWAVTKIESYEAFAAAFAAAYSEYVGKEVTPETFMDVSFNYGNLDDFFDNAKYSADWAWVRTFVVEYCNKTDNQYKSNIADKTADYHNTILRANVHGFINHAQWSKWPASANYASVKFEDFQDKVPGGKTIAGPDKYVNTKGATLVAPVKEGFDFAGWICGDEVITEIAAGTNGNLTLKAKWRAASGEQGVILVGPERAYKTIDEAMAVAMPGDVIKLDAGTYEGGTISVANVKLVGPNAGINPVNTTRSAEAIFTGDINVAANYVTIDGIRLTGKARIVGSANGIEDLTITNVHIFECAINEGAEDSANAPFYFYTSQENAEFKNIVITNCLNSETKEGRGMILYGAHINGLTMKDNKFVGKRINYNDGIKIDSNAGWGIKGKVEIVSNHFENYAQYVIWVRLYGDGEYDIQNNVFINNGQTAGSHAAISFIKYGGNGGNVSINFMYNTVDNSYMAARIDKTDRTAENLIVHINYNKIKNCKASYYVKNGNDFNVDAANNYYEKTPVAQMFSGAVWEPYYTDETKVPLYGQPLTFKAINYELDGGELDEAAPKSFDSTTGLAVLPTPTKRNRIFVGWLMNGEFVTSIPAGTDTAVTLTAVWREDAIYVSKNGESYAVATLAEAIAKAKAGDKIIVLAGEYEENITISVANLTLVGVNQGINPNTGTRGAEAIIKGVITITASATDLTIDGLAFTGNAKVKNASNNDTISGLTFQNNVVYDMEATTAWILNRYQMDAFLEIKVSSGASNNIGVYNNKFTNVGNVNVLVNRVENLSVDGNVFKDFGRDAVRSEGGYSYGILAFTNNHFEQTTAGHGYAGIFTYSISGGAGTNAKAVVKGNTFIKVGSNDTSIAPYNGALISHVYQENKLAWIVEDNVFDHCSNIMWLRNNGAKESTWSCTVQNNQFLGIPQTYYFGTYRGADTESTNPHLAVFGANYYEDNDGNVITDLTQYADMFKHLNTYGTTLEAKPGEATVEAYEFWRISYDLDGGTAKGLVTHYNRETGAIKLPTPTWNIYHEFKGWTLDGVTITEIPEGTKGDLHIVAVWEEIEGNPVTLEFELNGGNWNYASFDEISLDLLNDYNTYGGTNYTQDNVPSGAWENINVHTFFYSEGMSEKWGWLAAWLGQVGGTPNRAACTALTTKESVETFNAANENYKYAVSYEFRAIMKGSSVTSNGNYKTSDYSDPQLREQVWEPYNATVKTTLDTTEGKILTLPTPKKPFLTFMGWYDNAEFTGDPVTTITVGATNPKYYAKFIDPNPVTGINILNGITETKRFTKLQLQWEVLPGNATNKDVKFVVSDPKIATVSSEGLINFLVAGTVTIKVVSSSNPSIYAEMTVNVYVPQHIEGSFKTNSYVVLGQTIELLAEVKNGEGQIEWSSKDESIATVNNGVVTPVKAGTVTIVASLVGAPEVKLEYVVVVLEEMPEGVVEYLLRQNNSNIFLRSELGIGAGNYAYYSDILSSVSKLLFVEYKVDKTYYTDKPTLNNHSGERTGALEFITVHYTGNMAAGSYASSNANYFTKQSTNSSIHYVTGNEGIYACYDEKYVTWHAGDGTGTPFEWYPTGVLVKADDPTRPVVTITANSKFAINGTESTISCPTGYSRVWDPVKKEMVDDKLITPTDSKYLTDLGPAVKVVDGQYYIGRTWWCNNQVAEGRVCSLGGNLNSIGIETACNEGSDLWLTWQKTAQLVADLMIRYNLDIERVKGHNFYSAKDCPQPMLENEDEIWWEFIELCKAEHEAMSTYKDWKFTMESNNPDIVDNTGRVINQPEYDTCVTYTVTCVKGEETKTITLSSMVPGYYRNLARGER